MMSPCSSSEGRAPAIPAVILAGGDSRRFGSNKALAQWHGRPMIESVIDSARSAGSRVMLSVSNKTPYRHYDLPIVEDEVPQLRTPLNGLIAAARTCNGYFLVLTADSPGVTPPVIRLLLSHLVGKPPTSAPAAAGTQLPRPVVLSLGTSLYPFPGVYHHLHLEAFERAMRDGCFRLRRIVARLNPVMVPESLVGVVDPQLAAYRNINTGDDLELLAASAAV